MPRKDQGLLARIAVTCLSTLFLAMGLPFATLALATFPGENGKLAFAISRRGIFTAYPDGSHLAKLVDGGFPIWSADGSRIAFSTVTGDLQGIFVMNADGTGMRRLTRQTLPGFDFPGSWSPDGHQIVFSRRAGFDEAIFTIRLDGTRLRQVTEWGLIESPAWSPDGSRIAFMRDNDIWVMDPDGSDPVQLTFEGAYNNFPSWSPDGKRIIWSRANIFGIKGEIWIMNADGTNQMNLTNTETFSEGDPAWSPDGTKIAFAGDPENDGSALIYTINADGSGLEKLSGARVASNFGPDWQPRP